MSRSERKSGSTGRRPVSKKPPVRQDSLARTIAEWTFTCLLLLFGTSTIAQPFVIPTSSMEDNLMTGDHLLVDKLSYAPAGSITRRLLPYQDVQRGDII